MHPILFRIPVPNWNLPRFGLLHTLLGSSSIPIYSYGVMLGLSLVVGWYLTLYLAEKDGLPKETMANCYVVTAIAALIGSRLLYVVTNLNEFETLKDFFAFRRGGLVAYGGFLGGFVGSWLYLKIKKLPLMPWADAAVPSLASGLAITRIGCYLFGCDFGKPLTADAPKFLQNLGSFPHWAQGTVDHGDGSPAWIQHVNAGLVSHDSPVSLPVHPTQIYESLVGMALLALLLWQRKHQRFRGQVFMLFVFAYGFARFLLEIVRDDAERGNYGPELGQHVLIPGALLVFGIGYCISFAQSIPVIATRRITQVLAFVPAIAAYVMLRPDSFMTAPTIQLSTSQWVGLLTALAVCVAFILFWKVAEAHPEGAMALHLEAFLAKEASGSASDKAEASPEKAQAEEAPPAAERKGGRHDPLADEVEEVLHSDLKSKPVLDAVFEDEGKMQPGK